MHFHIDPELWLDFTPGPLLIDLKTVADRLHPIAFEILTKEEEFVRRFTKPPRKPKGHEDAEWRHAIIGDFNRLVESLLDHTYATIEVKSDWQRFRERRCKTGVLAFTHVFFKNKDDYLLFKLGW